MTRYCRVWSGSRSSSMESHSSSARPEMTLKRMAALREHVQRYIKETRWAIWALRSPIAAEYELPVLLERTSARLLSDTEVDLVFRTTGVRRTLTEIVQQQILRITHLNSGISSNPGTVPFTMAGGRARSMGARARRRSSRETTQG